MKALLFTVVFLASNCFGQAEIINTSLTDPGANVAYRFLENSFQITNFEKDSTVILLVNNDTLSRIGVNDYRFIFYGKLTQTDTLVAIKNSEIIAQKIVRIENLSQPKFFLGTIRDSLVTKEQLLSNDGLLVSFEPQLAKSNIRVLTFSGNITKTAGKKSKFEQAGNNFDKIFLKRISKMKKGDVLIIENVKTICPDCVARNRVVNLRFVII